MIWTAVRAVFGSALWLALMSPWLILCGVGVADTFDWRCNEKHLTVKERKELRRLQKEEAEEREQAMREDYY